MPFSPETLALERMRPGDRSEEDQRALAGALGLADEYWSMESVLDRSPGPRHPPGYQAYTDFFTCRHVRLRLLEAARSAALLAQD